MEILRIVVIIVMAISVAYITYHLLNWRFKKKFKYDRFFDWDDDEIVDNNNFRVDIGNGIELLTYDELNNLPQEKKDYIFRNARSCTSLTTLPDDFKINVDKTSEMCIYSKLNDNQKKYCIENNLVTSYPFVGMAVIIDADIKEMFNQL